MTREEAISQLKTDRDMYNFINPLTGEEEPINEGCRKSVAALDMAIKALEQEIYEKAYKEGYDKGWSDGNFIGANKYKSESEVKG